MNDIIINKIQSMQRCIARAREERKLGGENFAADFSHQDAAILNITRACEQAIALANYVIKTQRFGIPTSSGESFDLLARKKVISEDLALRLKKMVGFRNIAVHVYHDLDIAIIESVIRKGLDDLVSFGDAVRMYEPRQG